MNQPERGNQALARRIDTYLNELEKILRQGFAAEGEELRAMFANVESDLPADILNLFQMLSQNLQRLNATAATDGDECECIFVCGQLAGRLDALVNQRAAESLMATHAEGLSPEEFAQTDLTAIARFIAVRDKIMRTVADFTLKVLLVVAGLLAIGLLLGLI